MSAAAAAVAVMVVVVCSRLLTWRDMQHIVVLTARPQNLKANDWVTNGAGHDGIYCSSGDVTVWQILEHCVTNLPIRY